MKDFLGRKSEIYHFSLSCSRNKKDEREQKVNNNGLCKNLRIHVPYPVPSVLDALLSLHIYVYNISNYTYKKEKTDLEFWFHFLTVILGKQQYVRTFTTGITTDELDIDLSLFSFKFSTPYLSSTECTKISIRSTLLL